MGLSKILTTRGKIRALFYFQLKVLLSSIDTNSFPPVP
jgi:hypothetical protein